MLALYIPRPADLNEDAVVLSFCFIVLLLIARYFKFSLIRSGVLMVIGACLAVTPDLLRLAKEDLGDYGNFAREVCRCDRSDAFFAVVIYMHTGLGKVIAFAGMLGGLICHVVIASLMERRRKGKELSEANVPAAAPSDGS